MKILVIGSEGFIGSHCVDYFLGKGHEITGIDLIERPVKQYNYFKVSRLSPEFEEVFEHGKLDLVINAAGSANVSWSMQHPVSDFESNCLDTIRILEALRKHQVKAKYIHFSSAAVYGNPEKLPVLERDRLQPLSAYGWHKLIAEKLCLEYSNIYHLNIAIIRPFSVYGEGLKKQIFWDLFQKTHDQLPAIELNGNGKESRDFIHVLDLIQAIECISDYGLMSGEIYNLASGQETKIEDVVRIFFDALGGKQAWHFNGRIREGDPLNWRADITKLKTLGFTPAVDLSTGIFKLTNWMKSLVY